MKKKTIRRKLKKQRRTRKNLQRGGGFAYEIPPNALVSYRSMDDSGTEVPRIVRMGDINKDSERA